MRVLTLGFLNCPEATPVELVDVAADAGFTSVGLRITGRRVDDSYPPVIGNLPVIEAIRERLRMRGVALSNLSAYHLYPDVGLRELVPVLETTRALGGDTVLVSCYDSDHIRFATFLSNYADEAAAHGARVAFEFVPFSEAKNLQAALAIVERADRPNVGLVIDPLHLARSGGRPEELYQVPPGMVFFAQLCDASSVKPAEIDLPAEARTRRLAPGAGTLPLREMLDALPADLEIECEFPTVANKELRPRERAKAIHDAASRFLDQYDRASRNQGRP